MDNQTLITEYAQNGSESAFRELMSRCLNFVYTTAVRLVGGDCDLAKDVTQLRPAMEAGPKHTVLWMEAGSCVPSRMETLTAGKNSTCPARMLENQVDLWQTANENESASTSLRGCACRMDWYFLPCPVHFRFIC